jgi:sialic acid synthase SpsE
VSYSVFEISGRKIGYNYDPLVIAEIGINHNGSLTIAKQLVDAAINAGAEVIKHQTHVVEDEMSKAAKSVIPSHTKESIYEIMENCALSEADETALKSYVEAKGAIFISTPFSRAAADRLERMGVSAYKIGSGECNNYPLIEHIARFGKPIILSTGMNDIESVRLAVEIFRRYQVPYALLHCTNVYPTPPELVRLGALAELAAAFPDAVIGLSDHTVDNFACLGAVALGASILERHFTDSMNRQGPDIVCSMDPVAMAELIRGAKILKRERGGSKGAVAEEQSTINFAYASVVTIRPIRKGELFTEHNLWVKRPGTGDFKAKDYSLLLGKKATRDLENDVLLSQCDVDVDA